MAATESGPYICDRCLRSGMADLEPADGPPAAVNRTSILIPKPMEIKRLLDQHVVGQEVAKSTMAVAVYNHYKRRRAVKSRQDLGVNIQKSNILLLGPSGSGKTELARSISKILGVPFHKQDASKLTQAGYVGGLRGRGSGSDATGPPGGLRWVG